MRTEPAGSAAFRCSTKAQGTVTRSVHPEIALSQDVHSQQRVKPKTGPKLESNDCLKYKGKARFIGGLRRPQSDAEDVPLNLVIISCGNEGTLPDAHQPKLFGNASRDPASG
ncbi:MAG TPA: hypothetical protein VFT61_02185 [Sphingomicrobium sp.]|nr:hypothetical protein [Sphingomicrobium sp.]